MKIFDDYEPESGKAPKIPADFVSGFFGHCGEPMLREDRIPLPPQLEYHYRYVCRKCGGKVVIAGTKHLPGSIYDSIPGLASDGAKVDP